MLQPFTQLSKYRSLFTLNDFVSCGVSLFEIFNLMPHSYKLQGGWRCVRSLQRLLKTSNIVVVFVAFSSEKTRTLCKVHYTPMVPCCPEMNSGNCFQWEWTIRNERDLSGVVLQFCSFVCPISSVGRKWSWESVRETKTLRETVFWWYWSDCQVYMQQFPFTPWVSSQWDTPWRNLLPIGVLVFSLCVADRVCEGIQLGSNAYQPHWHPVYCNNPQTERMARSFKTVLSPLALNG